MYLNVLSHFLVRVELLKACVKVLAMGWISEMQSNEINLDKELDGTYIVE